MAEQYKEFVEPKGEDLRAGLRTWKIPDTYYDRFMDEEGIPVYRGIGMYDLRDIPRRPWKRMGGLGTYIQLDGTDGRTGMYALEIPPMASTTVEHHLYDEVYYVFEGRGSTEVWLTEGSRKHVFEWQPGSLFSIPVNTHHRLINATSGTPALLLAGTSAPAIFNLFNNANFIYNASYQFTDRFDDTNEYFKPVDDVKADPMRQRAMRVTNLIPDIATCDLPLDNQRSPGYRRIIPRMAGGSFHLFVGEHLSGRYAVAHRPPGPGSAVLICIKGKGYTFAWPQPLGTRPWEAGLGDQVERQDYKDGGMVASNPGGTGWFHMHHGISQDALRLLVFTGANEGVGPRVGRRGEDDVNGNLPIEEGGRSITYQKEDPFIRQEYQRMLGSEGAQFTMPEQVYTEGLRTDHVLEVPHV